MKINQYVETPRFGQVRIQGIMNAEDAHDLGYIEPTHYDDVEYQVMGRHIGTNRMIFAAVLKGQ